MRGAGLIAGLALVACLPNPQSVKERRENFDRSDLGDIVFRSEPSDMIRVDAVFDRIKLVGYKLDPPQPKPGDRVAITFYWSALKPVAEDYQVFVHGDAMGEYAARIHGDHWPAAARYPTDVWQEGEIIADTFKMIIPPGYGAARLGIYTGLYKGNYRVPLTNPGLRPNPGENRSLPVEIVFR